MQFHVPSEDWQFAIAVEEDPKRCAAATSPFFIGNEPYRPQCSRPRRVGSLYCGQHSKLLEPKRRLINELSGLKCRFDCDDPAVAIVYCETGCVCWPDRLQALCMQHLNTCEPLKGGCRVVYGYQLQAVTAEEPTVKQHRWTYSGGDHGRFQCLNGCGLSHKDDHDKPCVGNSDHE